MQVSKQHSYQPKNKRVMRIGTKLLLTLAIGLATLLAFPSSSQAFSGSGGGVNMNPYVITNCSQLQEMKDDLDAHYTITSTIDCSDTVNWNDGAGFEPIGSNSTPFTGRLLAQGHTITNLTINRPGVMRIGMFGVLDGDVFQLRIHDADITAGTQDYSGVLASEARSNSYVYLTSATGAVSGFWWAGGLIGSNAGTIEDSYANVAVSSPASRVGGLVGENSGTITNAYSRGTVQTSAADYGGLVGYATSGTVSNSFWDSEASGQGMSDGGTAKTISEMKDVATFTNTTTSSGLSEAWDFADNPNDDVENNNWWTIDASRNQGYPYFSGENYPIDEEEESGPTFDGGDGSEESPYQISSCEQLQSINTDETTLSSHYRLVDDIDCSATGDWNEGEGFVPIGAESGFSGSLDGDEYTISELLINRSISDRIGLFAEISEAGVVENLYLENVTVRGDQAVGALAGVAYGTVHNSHSSGYVRGNDEVGGLVGGHNGWDTIEDSSSSAHVEGDWAVGGLVGSNYGNIYDSFATGSVIGLASVGGFVGHYNGGEGSATVSGSYATGDVEGEEYVGGFVGFGAGGILESSYAVGNVDGIYPDEEVSGVGGFGGQLEYTYLDNVYATGDVSAEDHANVGGLVGMGIIAPDQTYATGEVEGGFNVGGHTGYLYCEGATVTESFSLSEVTGLEQVGGFAGEIDGCGVLDSFASGSATASEGLVGGFAALIGQAEIANIYASGEVTGEDSGGLVAEIDSDISVIENSFWDTQTTGQESSAAGTGKTSAQMKSLSTFTDDLGESAWNFDEVWAMDDELNQGYPCLQWAGDDCFSDGVEGEYLEGLSLLIVQNDTNQTHDYLEYNNVDYDIISTSEFADASVEFFFDYNAVIYEPGEYPQYDDLREGLPNLESALEQRRIVVSIRVAGNDDSQEDIDFLGTDFIQEYDQYVDFVDVDNRFLTGDGIGGVQLNESNFEFWGSTFHGWLDNPPTEQDGYNEILGSEYGPLWIEYGLGNGWVMVDTLTSIDGGWGGGNDEVADNYIRYIAYLADDAQAPDADEDGSPDFRENDGPNNGDANNDGTPDSEQANVASMLDPVSGEYAVLEVDEQCSIQSLTIVSEEVNDGGDADFNYPAGLMDFRIDCEEEGFTATITQYYYGITGDFTVRKYKPGTGYFTIEGASTSDQTIAGNQVKVATYQIEDGSNLDLDDEVNGSIEDPAGLAEANSLVNEVADLASTGQNILPLMILACAVASGSALAVMYQYKKDSMGRVLHG